ncbi:MAG: class I SAM-dependent methyltransferase [Patescibacteria group bacterium]
MFLKPSEVVKHLALRSGLKVGDFGAGGGEYAPLVLAELQNEGALYAFDVVPEMVERLHRKKVSAQADNFFTIHADLNTALPLKGELLDRALVINTLYALRERARFLSELNRVLARGGQTLFVDWTSSFKNMGPREEEVVSPGEAVRLFQSHGFSVGTMLPAGSHHYAFVARKQ